MSDLLKMMLDMSSGCIRILQLIGYFQLSPNKNGLVPWSMYWRLTFGFILTMFYSIYLFLSHRFGSKWCSDSLAVTVTEQFSHNSMLIAYTVLKLYYIIVVGCANAKSAENFWKINVEKLSEFCEVGTRFDFTAPDSSHVSLLAKVKRDVFRINCLGVCITFFTALIMSGMCTFYMISKHGLLELKLEEMAMPMLCFLWCLQTHSHYASAVYKAFFLRVYSVCVQIIHGELAQLVVEDTDDKMDTGHLGFPATVRIRRTKECMRAYGVVTKLIREFNRHFGPEIIVELCLTIVCILLSIFFSVAWGYTRMYLTGAVVLVPASLFGVQLFVLSSEATSLQENTNLILHELVHVPSEDFPHCLEVQIQVFATHLSANPPVVHACYFTKVGRHLLTSIASALLTYLIVLVQFRKTDL